MHDLVPATQLLVEIPADLLEKLGVVLVIELKLKHHQEPILQGLSLVDFLDEGLPS